MSKPPRVRKVDLNAGQPMHDSTTAQKAHSELQKLQITRSIVILVTPENNNSEYAARYLEKMGLVDENIRLKNMEIGRRSKRT